MAFNERFTDDERFLLASTPSLIGSAMAFTEGSGLGTIKELMANAKSILAGVKDYPNNEIIKAVVPSLENRQEGLDQAKAMREKAMSRLKDKGIDSREKLHSQLLEDCRAVSKILADKASPQEGNEYKDWAMSVAANVAKSAKEGGFLGIGGERISAGEKTMFAEIGQALGSSAQLV
jgi:hypothetical protein